MSSETGQNKLPADQSRELQSNRKRKPENTLEALERHAKQSKRNRKRSKRREKQLIRRQAILKIEVSQPKSSLCDKVFARKSNLYDHAREKHMPKIEPKPLDYVLCLDESIVPCDQVTTARNGKRKNKCTVCQKIFAQKSSLDDHTRVKHLPKIEPRPLNNFPCDLCDNQFISFRKLYYHKRGQHHATSFEAETNCGHCTRKFKSMRRLLQHYTNKCQYCHKGCPNDDKLRTHEEKCAKN